MRRGLRTAHSAVLAVLVLCPGRAGAELPDVRISSWEKSANGTGVAFKPLAPTAVETESIVFSDETQSGSFAYSIDTSDLRWAPECRCYRYYIITVRSKATGNTSRHKFKAIPSGSFEDQSAQVRLTVVEPGHTDADDISLPVASAPGLEPSPFVEIETTNAISDVSLGGTSEIQLRVRNPSRNAAVQLPTAFEVSSDNGALWKESPAVVSTRPFPITLAPNATETVRLLLQARTSRAMEASFIPSSKDKPHTAVHLRLACSNPLFQQRDGVAEIRVPLRFKPGIYTLLGALAAGVLMGSIITTLRNGQALAQWSRATVTAFGVALVFELLAIFLVANNSKFVLFDLDMDPWQTLPVLLLGIGNGLLGLEAAKRLKFVDS